MEKWRYVPRPASGRRFVVADIHGCCQTLQALVREQIKLTSEDQLFFLGDYINRGPDSLGVIQFIMGLQAAGYQVFPLRGNHEAMLLEKMAMRRRLKEDTTLIGRKSLIYQLSDEEMAWVERLPFYYLLDDFVLVHGALNTAADSPLEDYEYMLWERNTPYPAEFLEGKQLLVGHTIHSMHEICEAIAERFDCIPLDNGCYRGSAGDDLRTVGGYGKLCALELNSWTLFAQKNID